MPADSTPASAALDNDDDFDFLSGTDETATKLDLARAYIDMGDTEGARDILDEVITEGNEGQQNEARELIAKLV
jgi:pilus assembly protein FimV